jgi:hypothetical protein
MVINGGDVFAISKNWEEKKERKTKYKKILLKKLF